VSGSNKKATGPPLACIFGISRLCFTCIQLVSVSPPLERIFGYIPFSRRWDTVRYSGIQLDTARYVRIDRYSWIQAGIQRDTVDMDMLQNG